MTWTLRLVAIAVAGVVVVLALGVTGAWPNLHREVEPYADGPRSPRLVVDPGWTRGGPYAELRGNLGVNEQGCLTLSGDVILAQGGARVSADGAAVTFRHHRPVAVTDAVVSAGGYVGGRSSVRQRFTDDSDRPILEALLRCLGDDPDASVVQVWFG